MKKVSKIGLAGVLAATSVVSLVEEAKANNTDSAVSGQVDLSSSLREVTDGEFTFRTKFKTNTSREISSLAFISKKEDRGTYMLFYLKDGKIGYEVQPNVGMNQENTIGSRLADDKYHDLTISFSASRKKLFIIIDGKFAHSRDLTDGQVANLRTKLFSKSNYVGVGTGIRGQGNPYPFRGTFKDYEVQPTALKDNLVSHRIENKQKLNISDSETLNQIKSLKNATITATFLGNPDLHKSTIFKLQGENGQLFDVYLDPSSNAVGIEMNSGTEKKTFSLEAKHLQEKGINIKDGKLHTISVVHLEKGQWGEPAYEFYIDGKYINQYARNIWTLSNKITAPTSLFIASDESAPNVIDVNFIPAALGEKEIKDLHSTADVNRNIYTDQGLVPKPTSLFYSGYDNSSAYRIPSLFTTSLGTQIAAIDKRRSGFGDQGNIDTLIRRKEAGQTEFSDSKVIIDLPGKGHYTPLVIDPAMLQAKDGTIYMLLDMFPQSRALMGLFSNPAEPLAASSGHKEINGKKYLKLYTTVTKENPQGTGSEYTVRENGIVYDAQGNKTNFQVELGDNIKEPYNEIGSLFENGNYVGNIFINTADGNNNSDVGKLKAVRTSYLWLMKSTDDGKTWSKPIDINGQVKPEWATFMGVGPGVGLTMDNGYLAFPIYTINHNGGLNSQSSHLIISKDNGRTWTLGESPQKTRNYDPSEGESSVGVLTEAQAFQAKNGHVIMFMRTSNKGKASPLTYAISKDHGETWYKIDKFGTDAKPQVYETDTQMSNTHFEYNGEEYILHSGPGRHRRFDGSLTLGKITYNENNEVVINWQPKKLYAPGEFAYSSITHLGNGRFASLYEGANGKIEHVEFDMDWLTKPQVVTPIDSLTVNKNTSGYYRGHDNHLYVWVKTNAPAFVMSNPTISLEVNGQLLENKNVIPYTDGFFVDAGEYTDQVSSVKLKSINNTNGKILSVNANELVINDEEIPVYVEEGTVVNTKELYDLIVKTNELKSRLVDHSKQLVDNKLEEILSFLEESNRTQSEINTKLFELTKLNREVIYSHIFDDFKKTEYTQYTADKYKTIYPELFTKVSDIDTKLANGEISGRQQLLNEMMKLRAYVNTLKPAHVVTYNLDGGTNAETNLAYVKEGETTPLAAPTKENYVFKGWYNGDQKVENLSDVTADVTLNAKWELDPILVNNAKLRAKYNIDLAKFHKDYAIAMSDASEDAKNKAREEVLRVADEEKVKVDAATTLEGIQEADNAGVTVVNAVEVPTAAKELEVAKVDILSAIDGALQQKLESIDETTDPDHVKDLLKAEATKQANGAKEKITASTSLQEALTRYQIGVSNVNHPKVGVSSVTEVKDQKVEEEVANITTETVEIPFEEMTVEDATMNYGERIIEVEGAVGTKVIEKAGEEVLKETVTKEPVTRVVKLGTMKKAGKPQVAPTSEDAPVAVVTKDTVELPYAETVIEDSNINYGEEVVEVAGENGTKVVEKVEEEVLKETVTKEPVTKVVKLGTKKEVAKPQVAPTSEDSPTLQVTKETVELPFKDIVVEDSTINYGEEVVEVEGAVGTKVIETAGEEVLKETVTKEPVTRVVKLGTKKETAKPQVAPVIDDSTEGTVRDIRVLNDNNSVPNAVITKETEKIPYKTIIKEDAMLAKGKRVVVTEGEVGEKVIEKIGEEVIKENITKKPVDRIEMIGTKEEVQLFSAINEKNNMMPNKGSETKQSNKAMNNDMATAAKEDKNSKVLPKTGLNNNNILATAGLVGLSLMLMAVKRRKNK